MHARIEPDARGVELGTALPFALGDVQVVPAARRIEGPAGRPMLEPRVMQLLVALADRPGEVVPREMLLERCWAGMIVGDDSLNRAVAGLRRGLAEAGSAVTVATVPRVGYRLDGCSPPTAAPDAGRSVSEAGVSRRALLVGAGGALALGAGGLAVHRRRQSAEHEALLREADRLLWTGDRETSFRARGMLERAVFAAPDEARLWGLLAVARTHLAEQSDAANVVQLRAGAAEAVARALALDGQEGNALAARAARDPLFGAWAATHERLSEVAARGAETEALLNWQSRLAGSVGEMQKALQLCEGVLARNPDNAFALRWRSHGLWAAGRLAEAEAAARHAGARSANMRINLSLQWLLAHSGRPDEAEAMLRSEMARHSNPSRLLGARLAAVRAIATGTTADLARAEAALLEAARLGGETVFLALLELGALERLDAAFALARSWYLDLPGAGEGSRLAARYRRQTASLFLPPLAAMRADPRFLDLMRAIGLVRVWQVSGLRPDYLSGRLLPV